ncbi:Hypothetical predicted protein [Cloeon dipterum]|uniref:Ionotropic glutamate receptor C-terminal domain-containing protein n=1 Tax=Cloeon dipterum TaxID=197152 RepID=A0A8S1C2E4_9INSE|nr:Hypothetical predicted protein [Cloeon dipterum]
MALPLLILFLLPVNNHGLQIICDTNVDGEWQSECDFFRISGELGHDEISADRNDEFEQDEWVDNFGTSENDQKRFSRGAEAQVGLRLPNQNQCPEDLMLSRMVSRVLDTYFSSCVPVLRYDRFLENSCGVQKLLSGELSQGLTHGRLSGSINTVGQSPVPRDGSCAVLVFMVQHVEDARAISRAGTSHGSALMLVTASPLWRVEEFVNKWDGRPWKMIVIASAHRKRPVMSTKFLNPWFPTQISVIVRNEPPYSIHRPNETGTEWSGIERTIVELLAYKLNFTFTTKFVAENEGTNPLKEAVASLGAEIASGGVFFSRETHDLATTVPYTQDCAVFLTRASTALPRHRAILGPFQLVVWIILTLVYIFLSMASAASPHAKGRPRASQTRLDAFWLVFGTFTNAFFVRGRVWSDRISVRILLTFYWIFTVIITAAYTSSIIAFVTMPVFPSTVESAEEILNIKGFRWGTLGSSGWEKWLQDAEDPVSRHIQAGFEWLPKVEDGIRNVSKSARYAFLGSRERLQYESSDELKGILSGKKALHLGTQCFLPLLPSFLTTPAIRPAIDPWIHLLSQFGFIAKAVQDISYQEHRRRLRNTATGTIRVEYTKKMPHERRLSVEDVTGTFFILGAGVIMACERVIYWFKVNQIAARISSSVNKARRKVSVLSGSNSCKSSQLSLRLRSGRIWSKGARGSTLGSMLEMVPEKGANSTPNSPDRDVGHVIEEDEEMGIDGRTEGTTLGRSPQTNEDMVRQQQVEREQAEEQLSEISSQSPPSTR